MSCWVTSLWYYLQQFVSITSNGKHLNFKWKCSWYESFKIEHIPNYVKMTIFFSISYLSKKHSYEFHYNSNGKDTIIYNIRDISFIPTTLSTDHGHLDAACMVRTLWITILRQQCKSTTFERHFCPGHHKSSGSKMLRLTSQIKLQTSADCNFITDCILMVF